MVSARTYRLLRILIPLFLLVLARGFIGKTVEEVRDAYSLLQFERHRIENSGVRTRGLPELKADFEALARKKAQVSSSLFAVSSEASLYDLLFLKAEEAGAIIISVSSRPKRRCAGYDELPLQLRARGAYHDLALLVNRIETSSRLLHIGELRMSVDGRGELTADMDVTAYLQSADSTKTAGPRRSSPAPAYLAALQKALAVRTMKPAFSYAATGGDPFSALPVRRSGAKATGMASEAPNVKLKGILWKQPPLAVLESLDGQTLILREGDEIGGYKVQSILRSAVNLVGPKGTHVLEQYQQK